MAAITVKDPPKVKISRNEIIKILIAHGADPNLGKKTPLMSAVREGNIELVKTLLENGADPNQPSLVIGFGKKATPLEQAQKEKKQDIVDLINEFLQKKKK